MTSQENYDIIVAHGQCQMVPVTQYVCCYSLGFSTIVVPGPVQVYISAACAQASVKIRAELSCVYRVKKQGSTASSKFWHVSRVLDAKTIKDKSGNQVRATKWFKSEFRVQGLGFRVQGLGFRAFFYSEGNVEPMRDYCGRKFDVKPGL